MNVLFLNGPFHKEAYSRASRSPAVTKSGTVYYPIFLAYAAGLADRDGDFNVQLLDAIACRLDQDDLVDELLDHPPDLVFCETSTPSIAEDLRTVRTLKRAFGDCKVVMVGTHATAAPEEVLASEPAVDAVAVGEFDETSLELAHALAAGRSWKEVPGVVLRDGPDTFRTARRDLIADLDRLPFVSQVYDKFLKPEDYFFSAAQYPMVMIMTTRGCPFKCSWCLYPQVMHGGRYRKRSPENVAAEFAWISEHLPQVREVGIEDDLFTADKKWLRQTCELLIAQGNKLGFWVDTRITLADEEMKMMKKAGCRLLIAGFESATQEVLDAIEKGTNADEAERFCADARRNKLLVHGCFVFGQPGEDRASLERTLDYAIRLNPDTAQFFPMICYPGTRAYAWARENGYLRSDDYRDWLTEAGGHNATCDLPELPGEEVVEFCDHARKEFYLRQGYVFKKIRQSLTNVHEARRNFKAFKRLAKFLVQSP